jgi:PPE-repeat protein
MPFNTSTGIYTPPSGATTAAPGDLIKSATWDAIFTDLSSALTLLGQQLYGTTPVTSSSPYVPVATDTFVLIAVAGAYTVNLPTGASRIGYPLIIKDGTGTANTNNITINANGSDTIEGHASVVINASYGAYFLYPVSGGWIIRP